MKIIRGLRITFFEERVKELGNVYPTRRNMIVFKYLKEGHTKIKTWIIDPSYRKIISNRILEVKVVTM